MHKWIMIIVLASILLVSCGTGDRDETKANWRTGAQAIEMSFLQGTPPKVIYDGDVFDIAVEIWNRGASPLVGDLYLTGFDDSIFSGITKRPLPLSIEQHKTKYNTEGGYQLIRESGRILMPEGSDTFSTTIKAVACYFYETVSDVQVCVDPEPNKRDLSSDACQVRDVSVSGGQAAPVAVTNVKVESTPQKTIFRITIKNVGKGTVLDQAVVDECLDSDVVFADTNWIDLDSVRLGLDDFLQCEPPNPVKMSGGTATVACTADRIIGTSAYSSVLTVVLTYGYRDDIEQKVQLRST